MVDVHRAHRQLERALGRYSGLEPSDGELVCVMTLDKLNGIMKYEHVDGRVSVVYPDGTREAWLQDPKKLEKYA